MDLFEQDKMTYICVSTVLGPVQNQKGLMMANCVNNSRGSSITPEMTDTLFHFTKVHGLYTAVTEAKKLTGHEEKKKTFSDEDEARIRELTLRLLVFCPS